jgi:hypothetical protein
MYISVRRADALVLQNDFRLGIMCGACHNGAPETCLPNGPYEAGVFSKDRYAAYLIKARRKLST